MKILSIVLRAYFLVAGIGGVYNTYMFVRQGLDASLLTLLSIVITLCVGIGYLFFALQLHKILPEKKRIVQGVVIVAFCSTLATGLFGAVGLNDSQIFMVLTLTQLIVFSVVTIGICVSIVFLVEKISESKIKNV